MSATAELLADALVALVALGLAVDGARKLRNVPAFLRWLRSGDLGRLARPPVVVALGVVEVVLGAACVWPAGRAVAIAAIVAVTPLGAVLVRRTGVCACRGVIRSQSPRDLVIRNALVVAVLAGSLLLAPGPLGVGAVLLAGLAWAVAVAGRFTVLWRAPVVYGEVTA